MEFIDIIITEEIEDKLNSKHNVELEEVEDVLYSNPKIRFVEKGYQADEDVYKAMGQTSGGRYLIIFFIYKKTQVAVIISARDMTAKERKAHGRK